MSVDTHLGIQQIDYNFAIWVLKLTLGICLLVVETCPCTITASSLD